VLLALVLAVVARAPADARQIGTLSIGRWSGTVHTDDATGRFSHCAASTLMRNATGVVVGLHGDATWFLGLLDGRWNLQVGTEIPVTMSFDGHAAGSGPARAGNRHMWILRMESNAALIAEFRRSTSLELFAESGERLGVFSLDGSAAVMTALAACVEEHLARERGDAPRTAAAPPPRDQQPRQAPPAARPAANAAASPAAPAAASASATALQLEATRIASTFLLEARLPNAQLVPPSRTPAPLSAHGVMWTSDAMVGAVLVYPPGAAAGTQEVAALIIAEEARRCRGTFVSGRSSGLIDETVVTRAFSGCEDSSGSHRTAFIVVARSGGGQIAFGFTPLAVGDADAPPSPALDGPVLRAMQH
jgi:hypothetical protein